MTLLASETRSVRDELQARIHSMQSPDIEGARLPLLPALSGLLPGGLRAGAAYSVMGSTTLALAMMSAASQTGSWCAAIGLPHIGTEAAASLGIALDRLALIPYPDQHWAEVVAALSEVAAVVVTGPPPLFSSTERARLHAKLRQRDTALVTLGPWPQADATFRVENPGWRGLGSGYGLLERHEMIVSIEAKRAGRIRHVNISLDALTSGGPGQPDADGTPTLSPGTATQPRLTLVADASVADTSTAPEPARHDPLPQETPGGSGAEGARSRPASSAPWRTREQAAG